MCVVLVLFCHYLCFSTFCTFSTFFICDTMTSVPLVGTTHLTVLYQTFLKLCRCFCHSLKMCMWLWLGLSSHFFLSFFPLFQLTFFPGPISIRIVSANLPRLLHRSFFFFFFFFLFCFSNFLHFFNLFFYV